MFSQVLSLWPLEQDIEWWLALCITVLGAMIYWSKSKHNNETKLMLQKNKIPLTNKSKTYGLQIIRIVYN